MVTPPIPVVNDCWAVVEGPAVVGGTEEVGATEEIGAPVEVRAIEPLAEAEAAPQPSGPAMLSSLQSYQV